MFQETGKPQRALIGLESFLMLEMCCKQEILLKKVFFDNCEKFQEAGKPQRAFIGLELLYHACI